MTPRMFYTLARVLAALTVIPFHEAGHALAAWLLGDPTAKRNHRLSLNPLRHIDWIGLAAMVLTGVGWAKPVPVNPSYFKHPKRGMAITALAGPVSNLLLALWLCGRLREENAVEPFVLTVLRDLARFGKQAVVFAAAHAVLARDIVGVLIPAHTHHF